MKKHKALIVLKALLTGERRVGEYLCGLEVKIGQARWVLGQGSGTRIPCIIGTRQVAGGEQTETLLGVPDLTLTQFISMAEKMSDEEIASIVFMLGMRKDVDAPLLTDTRGDAEKIAAAGEQIERWRGGRYQDHHDYSDD